MGAFHRLVTLLVLPLVWCHSELRVTQGGPSEMPDDAAWAFLHSRPERSCFSPTSSNSVGHVVPRDTRVECFQVAEPILAEHGLTTRGESTQGDPVPEAKCSKLLMRYSFGESMNKPFYTSYRPPDCDFDRVVLHFDAKTEGVQFDRTGVLFLGDVLVWRTTTAEPLNNRIHWSWHKDVTPFLSLWKAPRNLIFELDNTIGPTLTGIYRVTLTASFFKSDVMTGGRPPADLIVPISRRRGSRWKPSHFIVPNQLARTRVDFPRNANRAVFTLDAKPQGNEEAWWHHLSPTTRKTFPHQGPMLSFTAFREISIELDGKPVGFVWPFPRIFTGFYDPGMWQPIVGMEAFDFREPEIDITSWLPLLCDGNQHAFQIKVSGLDDTKGKLVLSGTENSWYVTGKIFVWLDDEDSVTEGIMYGGPNLSPVFDLQQDLHKDDDGNNRTLNYTLTANRDFRLVSFVKTQKREGNVTWTQELLYSNGGAMFDYGLARTNQLTIRGSERSNGHGNPFSTEYNYPLFWLSDVSVAPDGPQSRQLSINQGLRLDRDGASVFPTGMEPFLKHREGRTSISSWRNGTTLHTFILTQGLAQTWTGQVDQDFALGQIIDVPGGSSVVHPAYTREVTSVDRAVTKDEMFVNRHQ